MKLLSYMRRLASRRRDRARRPEVDAFHECLRQLNPGDIAIDCGANVGKFTVPMAHTGAEVYAFEPNPDAHRELVKVTAAFPNVKVIQAAVTSRAGPIKLFLHRYAEEDPVHFSTGSSLLESKRNVVHDRYVTVEGVAFGEFVKGLGRPVRLLKMDIEGAEVDVINQLLDEGLHRQIEHAFVEVHDRQIWSLAEPTRKLRERLRNMGADQFRLDWR